MSIFWTQDNEDRWVPIPVPASGALLTGDPSQPLQALTQEPPPDGAAVLRSQNGTQEVFALVAGARRRDVHVNGAPIVGLRVLANRDEIAVGNRNARLFFSTETLAKVEPFAANGRKATCPRCHTVIEDGADSVRCPNCHVAHHQTREKPCWTYAEACASAGCGQPTALDAGYRWQPEE